MYVSWRLNYLLIVCMLVVFMLKGWLHQELYMWILDKSMASLSADI